MGPAVNVLGVTNLRADGCWELGHWELRDGGPAGATRSALLLPGLMSTAAFYDGLLADPTLAAGDTRLIAATPPGFGGRPAPPEVSVESYARSTAELAGRLDVDVVVGHSYFANVVLEMAAQGLHTGPIVLLSPCFSRADEEADLRLVDRMERLPLIGGLPWLIVARRLDKSLRAKLPAQRHDELVAEMLRSDMRVARRVVHHYFDHLDRYGSLVARLRDSGVAATVVRGDRDPIGRTGAEHRDLVAAAGITVVDVPDAGHFVMTDQPTRTIELILAALPALP